MELRTASSPRDVKTYDTARLREEFLIQNLFSLLQPFFLPRYLNTTLF